MKEGSITYDIHLCDFRAWHSVLDTLCSQQMVVTVIHPSDFGYLASVASSVAPYFMSGKVVLILQDLQRCSGDGT